MLRLCKFPSGTTFASFVIFVDQLLNASRGCRQIQGVIELPEVGLRHRCLAHMQGAPIALLEGGGDALLPREGLPQDLNRLASQDRDEQMPFGPLLLAVVDRPQPQFGLETAKDRVSMV